MGKAQASINCKLFSFSFCHIYVYICNCVNKAAISKKFQKHRKKTHLAWDVTENRFSRRCFTSKFGKYPI